MQTVSFSGCFSSTSPVTCGVPQRSVLSPVLLLLYMADVLTIARCHGIGAYSYADNTQLYRHAPTDLCVTSASAVASCIGELNRWMCSNRLKLNATRPTSSFLGMCQQIEKANFHSVQLCGFDDYLSTTVTCLGLLIDTELTFAAHIKHLTGRCFYQLCQLRTVHHALSVKASWTLVHAFVNSSVDYCNSILGSTSAAHLRPLQCILNAAARFIDKRRKIDRITDYLREELHWLPVQYRHT